ncbi:MULTISPECIES: hypothetical protein [Agrobacterium]|uniref:hypothetical protein n=1 Tax=Agrobacterium TaxID=357 RepID=UPI000A731782|nr:MULTISPECIES: hypothetical protein [Agrobacterium]
MSTNKHIDNLNSLREQLVELRRARAEYGVKNDPENAALHIAEVQKQIDALDKAIEDEAALLPAKVTVKKIKL